MVGWWVAVVFVDVTAVKNLAVSEFLFRSIAQLRLSPAVGRAAPIILSLLPADSTRLRQPARPSLLRSAP